MQNRSLYSHLTQVSAPAPGAAPDWRATAARLGLTSLTRRPYLVFVRAGADSLHTRMLRENTERNWDCCVNWYVEPPDEALAEYYCRAQQSVNKLEGFVEFKSQHPDLWPYRYVLLLDDDLYLRPGEISYFFKLCDYYGTFLSQPALRWFTHTTLNSLVRNPACVLRRVSFVEGMAPCFSAAALDELLHTFTWTRSIWGTDWAWAGLLEGRPHIHVVDAVAMEHTRTGNGRPTLFYRKLRALGVDPGKELQAMRLLFPQFRGPRTLAEGHVYRPGLPKITARAAMLLFERLKLIVRVRKQIRRTMRDWRARLEDLRARQGGSP